MIDNPYLLHEFLLENAVTLDYLRSKGEKSTIETQDIIRAFKLGYKMMEDHNYRRCPESLHEIITLIDRKHYADFYAILENATDIHSEKYDLEFLFNSILDVDEIEDDTRKAKYLELEKLDDAISLIEYLPMILWLKFNVKPDEIELYNTYVSCTIEDLKRKGFDWESIGC